MKIPLLTPALVAILGLALAGAPVITQADTSTNSAPDTSAPAPVKAKKTPFKGSITAIDAASVTVVSKEKTLTLAITPKTTFKKDKAPATLADFAVGDKVTGSYSTDASGAMTANSLHKKTVPPAATAAAPATPAAK
jgi:hypothetical protein